MGLKDKLRQGFERRFITVNVPLVGDVRLRSLSSSEMRALRNSLTDDKGETIKPRIERLNEILASMTIVDEAGNLEFTEGEAMSGAFDSMDAASAKVLFSHVVRHTGFTADSDWQAIEGAAKN